MLSMRAHACLVAADSPDDVSGMTDLCMSGGAEHQRPPGGGPVAIIVEKES
jgi:cyanuric acid amidohydrolase